MTQINRKKAYITYILIFINLIVFILEIRWGGSTNLDILDQLGALVPEKIHNGEWWRLLNANFLHFGWFHLLTNMLALLFVGSVVEQLVGSQNYLLVYLLSGVGSMLTFALVSLKTNEVQVVLMGASAAIMGIIGTILAVSWQTWLQQKSSLNAKRLRTVVFVIVLQFILDNLIPKVSFYSHLFGFIIGFLISSLLLQRKVNFK